MVLFTLQDWVLSLIVCGIFAVVVLVPCIIVGVIGTKMINRLGQMPSQSPAIHMSIIFQLVILEAVTFALLIVFYRFFS